MVLTFPAAYHNRNVIFFSLVYIALLWLINFSSFFFFLRAFAVVCKSRNEKVKHCIKMDFITFLANYCSVVIPPQDYVAQHGAHRPRLELASHNDY